MSKELIQEYNNGVKAIHVAEYNRNLVQEQSSDLHRLVVTKSPDRSDVSLFINKINNSSFQESTVVVNKEEALKLIYSLKVFLNITNEDIQTIEENPCIINKESYNGESEYYYKTFNCSICNYNGIHISDKYCSKCGNVIQKQITDDEYNLLDEEDS